VNTASKTAAGKNSFYLLPLLLAFACAPPARAAEWSAEALPAGDQLFQRTNGWIGADGDFAVRLTNGLTLWLFSDTFVGDVRAGQHGADPAPATVDFFCARTGDGQPDSLVTPADGHGWFWLFDGIMARGKLFLFLQQIESTGGDSAFGFRQTGAWLGEVSHPLAPPPQWQVRQQRIPFAHFNADESLTFGSAVLATNGFVYIYGERERQGAGKKMILARVPAAALGDFPAWQFRGNDGWTTNADGLADLCPEVASEYSVSWLPARRAYVLICTRNGLSDKIMARTAPQPWGPWSPSTVVFQCPEMSSDKRNFCYAAKAHPMLASGANEMILTYAANSFELGHVLDDARLYWPRFVRLRWK
jgi:hypothetical protein